MHLTAFLTGYYDRYKDVDKTNLGLYQIFGNKTTEIGVGIYNILLMAAVYTSIIALIASAILLMIANHQNGTKLSEAKQTIKKVLIVSLCTFAASGGVALLQSIAPQ